MKVLARMTAVAEAKGSEALLAPMRAGSKRAQVMDGSHDAHMAALLAERATRPVQAKAVVDAGYGDLIAASRSRPAIATWAPAMQPKLALGRLDDPREREADRAADRVMRMPASAPPARAGGTPSLRRKCDVCEEAQQLARKEAGAPRAAQPEAAAPPVVHEALASPGRPLDPAARMFFEPRFGHDFSSVRVHTDDLAAESAQAVGALAYTVGDHIVFGEGQSGQRMLLAHELAHVVQHHAPAERLSPRTLARVPAAPTTSAGAAVPFDRSKVAISDIADFVMSVVAGTPVFAPQAVTATFTDPTINHLVWELYDPSDQMLPGSFGTVPGSAAATTTPFVIGTASIQKGAVQGRYLLRCTGYKDTVPIVYADRSFFIWTSTPVSGLDLASLNAIKAAPATHSLGEVGAAHARSMMLEHQAAVAATGTGTVMGNQCPAPVPGGTTQHDCTTYVLEVLKQAFTAKGRAADWKVVFDEAKKQSGGAFKGTALLEALVNKAGWTGVFWSPDPKNPADSDPEHSSAYKKVKKAGTYYGIQVDASRSAVDYRPTSPTKGETMTGLDQLKSVPLAVIAARGGKHMTLLLNGQVYEVHWDRPPTDPNVIEATPLEKWAWLSGVVVMPP